jgi:hypothetical protein
LDVWLCAHASRAILNYAPIGAYHICFRLGNGNDMCSCRMDTLLHLERPLETQHHLMTNCCFIKYLDYRCWNSEPGIWRPFPVSLEEFLKLLKENPKLFAFNKVQVDLFFFFFLINNLYSGARTQSALYLSTCCNDHNHECPTVEIEICPEVSRQ